MQKTDVINPLAIGTPIAVNGDKNIPNQTATGTDTSSINAGFLPITSEPLDDGGVAPERTDFNGMFYLSTDQRVFLQNGGVITYNTDVATAIGGYPQDAVLGYIDTSGNFGFVKSLINNNQYDFVTNPSYIDGSHWEYANLSNFTLLDPTFTNINNQIAQCVKLTGNQSVAGNKTFTGTVKVPNLATVGTAVATAAISKTATANTSGYVKFGNGIILQWLKFTQSSDTANHTWSIAFTSSTSYTTVITQCKGGNSAQNTAVTAQTATRFTCYAENGERSSGLYAIAVGY